MTKNTKIVCGFPGIGKSHIFRNPPNGLTVADSDSMKFSWLTAPDATGKMQRNPAFPGNYLAHIEQLLGTVDIVFVSMHENVHDALIAAGHNIVIVYPDNAQHDEYVCRYRERGSPEALIKIIDANFQTWVEEIEQLQSPLVKKIKLTHAYLEDVLPEILEE